jgi:hypothetical protein
MHGSAYILAALAVACLASCAPPLPPPVASAVPAPRITPPVAPLVAAVAADLRAAASASAKLEGEVAALRVSAGGLAEGLDLAAAEVDRLKIAKAGTDTELDTLAGMLTAAHTQARNLFLEVEAAQATAAAHREARETAERRVADLRAAAAVHDQETAALRDQVAHYTGELDKAGKVHADLLARLSEAKSKAAVGGYLKGMIGWIIFAGVLIVAGVLFLKNVRLL